MRRDAEVIAESSREEEPPAAHLFDLLARHLRASAPAVTHFDADKRPVGHKPQAELPARWDTVEHSVGSQFGNAEPNVVLPIGDSPLGEGLDGKASLRTHRSAGTGKSSLA